MADVLRKDHVELEMADLATRTNTTMQRISGNNTIQLPVNTTIRATVLKKNVSAMEIWLQGISSDLQTFKGFIGREVIPPAKQIWEKAAEDDLLVYIILLRFENYPYMRTWLQSDERSKWLDMAAAFSIMSQKEVKTTTENKLLRIPTSALTASEAEKTLPAPKPSRPAKWKLSFIIFTGVFGALELHWTAGTINFFLNTLHLPDYLAILALLCLVVPLLQYGYVPLLQRLPPVGRWLRKPSPLPPPSWVFARAVALNLNDGLAIFAPAAPFQLPPQVLKRLDRLEGKIERLLTVNEHQRQRIASLEQHSEKNEQVGAQIDVPPASDTAPLLSGNNSARESPGAPGDECSRQSRSNGPAPSSWPSDLGKFHDNLMRPLVAGGASEEKLLPDAGKAGQGDCTAVFHHLVKWEYTHEFERWCDDITAACQQHPQTKAAFRGGYMIKPDAFPDGTAEEQNEYVLVIRYSSYDALNTWSRSKTRASFIPRLAEMVVQSKAHTHNSNFSHPDLHSKQTDNSNTRYPSAADDAAAAKSEILELTTRSDTEDGQVGEGWIKGGGGQVPPAIGASMLDYTLRDAFSELLVDYGEKDSKASRPPPVWKVMLTTITALYCIVLPVTLHLKPVLVSAGWNEHAITVFTAFLNVFVNSYVNVPIMFKLLRNWLSMARPVYAWHPWKALDQGLPGWRSQCFLVFSYALICILAGLFA